MIMEGARSSAASGSAPKSARTFQGKPMAPENPWQLQWRQPGELPVWEPPGSSYSLKVNPREL